MHLFLNITKLFIHSTFPRNVLLLNIFVLFITTLPSKLQHPHIVWPIYMQRNNHDSASLCQLQNCVVQIISIPTQRKVTGNSAGGGGGGILKAKIFKGMYEAKLEFPEGWEGSNQNLPWRGMDIFWKNTLFCLYHVTSFCITSHDNTAFVHYMYLNLNA